MKKFNPCLTLLLVVLLLLPVSMFAQSFKVSGTVSDKNGAIIGASVLVKGTMTGTSTDVTGGYTLSVPKSGSVLVFSFLGYKTQEIAVSSAQTTLNVKLDEDATALQDVVVLGFGAAARKADLSTSVGVVENMEENKNRPISSIEGLLQGQVAGVTVVNNGGDPTASPSVTIRGMGSKATENVLWVVDGVAGAPVNINDIESMVVLKDAASAAIYGAQSGAAGVILVTTKKAKLGAPSVTYEGSFGIRTAYNKPQSLTVEQERTVRTQSMAAAGMMISDLWDPARNPEMSATRTDWINEIFRNAFYQRHQVAINGGTEKFNSRVAFNYNGDEGTLQGTFNKTASVRYTGSYNITRHISISEDAMWSNNKQRGGTTGINTNEGYTGVIWSALSMPRSARAYYDDGSFGGTAEMGSNTAGLHGDLVNPLRLLLANSIMNKTQNFSTTTQLTIRDLLPGLKFNSRFTYRSGSLFYKKFSPRTPEPGKPSATNTLEYQTYDSSYWEVENALTYDNTFGKHTIGALIATTASERRRRDFAVSAKGFDNEAEANQYLGYATTYNAPTDGYMYPDNNVALVARMSYSFDNRYFVTASWRRDYAGRLPKGKKFGDFPAVTAAWKISGENFFKQNDVVTLLKLRASWGRVGNLGSLDYAYGYPTLSRDGNGDGAQVGGLTQNKTLIYLGSAINPMLSWETSEQTDIGLDVDMFKGRLSLSADYFTKRTFNLIQAQTTNWPDYIGIGAMMINQGEIRNRGFELAATWKEQVNKNWSYFVSGNFATLKNWVYDIGTRDIAGNPGVWAHDDSFRNDLKPYQTAQDQPLYTYYLIQSAGLFQSDAEAAAYTFTNKNGETSRIQPNAKAGDLKFVDYNGDGKIDSNDRQYMDSYLPKLTYSFSAGFSWKDLSFSMMWQGAAKSKAFNAQKYTLVNEAQGVFNRSTQILDAWPATNKIPRLNANDANLNFSTVSDFYLEDASYLRLKNITISYDMTRLLHKCSKFADRGSSMSLFVSGENLWTITNYTGMDPEVGGIGLDAGRYPVSRVFSIGVKITY